MVDALLAGGSAVVVTTDEDDMATLLEQAQIIPRLRSSAARVTILAV